MKLHKIIFLYFYLGFLITVSSVFAGTPIMSGEKTIEPSSSEKIAILHIEDSSPLPEPGPLKTTPSIEPSIENVVALDNPSQTPDPPQEFCTSLARPFSIEALDIPLPKG